VGAAPFGVKGAGFSSMRNPLRRRYGRGDPHFVTFSCYCRRLLLGTARARNRFVRILDEVRSRHAFKLIGYVVMPEHVHLLLRAEGRYAVESTASAEAEGFSIAARKRKEADAGAVVVALLPDGRGCGGVLAETILRFQCVE
jgi:hypothetical protein